MDSILDASGEKICILLVGNKCDLEEERAVSKEEGEQKAKEYNLDFFETSCKEGININEVFEKLTEDILMKNVQLNSNEGEKLSKTKTKKKSGCC